MKQQRLLETISALSDNGVVPSGVIEEGRIFSLGTFELKEELLGRVQDVVEGLRDKVGQPFDLHPWVFIYQVSTKHVDGAGPPFAVGGVVHPQSDGSVFVQHLRVSGKRPRVMDQFIYRHTPQGTQIVVSGSNGNLEDAESRAVTSFYLPAIAILNTRGCSIDLKRAPALTNDRRRKQGKPAIPARYEVDASEYFTALGSSAESKDHGGSRSSPIPHLRRGHERILKNGKRVWIPSALINVRSEGDIAFVERRKAYSGSDD